MSSVVHTAKAFAVAGLFALTAAPAFAAESPSARVAVPDRPAMGGGGSGGGCYSVVEKLYGPYSMSFCLGRNGSYKVTGGGLNCNGALTSSAAGNKLSIKLRRTSCGRGQAWTADSISCAGNGLIGGLVPFVAVPDRPGMPPIPSLTTISCTYTPAVPSYKPRMIRARRTS